SALLLPRFAQLRTFEDPAVARPCIRHHHSDRGGDNPGGVDLVERSSNPHQPHRGTGKSQCEAKPSAPISAPSGCCRSTPTISGTPILTRNSAPRGTCAESTIFPLTTIPQNLGWCVTGLLPSRL